MTLPLQRTLRRFRLSPSAAKPAPQRAAQMAEAIAKAEAEDNDEGEWLQLPPSAASDSDGLGVDG